MPHDTRLRASALDNRERLALISWQNDASPPDARLKSSSPPPAASVTLYFHGVSYLCSLIASVSRSSQSKYLPRCAGRKFWLKIVTFLIACQAVALSWPPK